MIKITGKEWKAYYADPLAWPDGAWMDDDEVSVDGEFVGCEFEIDKMPDSAKVELHSGTYFKDEQDLEGRSLTAHFKEWRKSQNTAYGSVEAPKEKAAAVRAAIIAAGGKVSGL